MWSILSNLKKSVVLAPVAIILMLAMGCGTAEPAPAAVPASEIASMVREAVQESVPAPAEAGPSAAEIQQLIEAAVSNAPAGSDCRRGPEIGSRGYFSGGCKRADGGDCRGDPASCGKLRPARRRPGSSRRPKYKASWTRPSGPSLRLRSIQGSCGASCKPLSRSPFPRARAPRRSEGWWKRR